MSKNQKAVFFKERYDIQCPHCEAKLDCAPSMFHQMGLFEIGGGACLECHQVMEIHYQPDTDTMQAYKAENMIVEEDGNAK